MPFAEILGGGVCLFMIKRMSHPLLMQGAESQQLTWIAFYRVLKTIIQLP